jgi:hypothetical protein
MFWGAEGAAQAHRASPLVPFSDSPEFSPPLVNGAGAGFSVGGLAPGRCEDRFIPDYFFR